jgi:hypothetical protein
VNPKTIATLRASLRALKEKRRQAQWGMEGALHGARRHLLTMLDAEIQISAIEADLGPEPKPEPAIIGDYDASDYPSDLGMFNGAVVPGSELASKTHPILEAIDKYWNVKPAGGAP